MNPEILKAHVCLCVRHAPVCVAATGRRRQVMVVQKKLKNEDFEALLLGLVAEKLCIHCAVKNGHTATEAMACDLFSLACPDCPLAITIADKEMLAEEIRLSASACACSHLSASRTRQADADRFAQAEEKGISK